MTQNAFEIPQQMRDLAESNIEQARPAYDQFMSAMNQALALWSKSMPSNPLHANFAALQNQATAFAKQNAEAAFALANDLAKASTSSALRRWRTRLVTWYPLTLIAPKR